MRVSRQGHEGRNDRVRYLRCGSSPRAVPRPHGNAANDTTDLHGPQPATPLTDERQSEDRRHTDQEQIQMIAKAIGTPKPSAPKIARTDSESRLAWCRAPDDGMTLLLGAPRAHARPQDERSIVPSDHGPRRLSVIRRCWAVMVNKRLIGIKRGLRTAPWRRAAGS